MDVRKLALMLGALTVAVISALMARSMFAQSAAPEAQASTAAVPAGPDVLVATRPLPVGTIITPESFRYQPWPKELVQEAYFIRGQSDAAALNGTVVRSAITAGQPITQGSLVKPGDRGFLAAALTPGMRAVTVSVSAQSGVGGFVFPGDHVDLLLASEVKGGGSDDMPLKAAETIVRNLRVLATDQRTDKVTDEQGKTQVNTFSTVTVETTPEISERIAVAQSIGTLSLSLRPLADDTRELERAVAAGEVDLPSDPKAEKQMVLALAQRPSDRDTTFTLGGDVSRFQRRSVPARTNLADMGGMSMPAVSMGPAAAAPAPAAASMPVVVVRGPVIRVARGNNVTQVSVGAK